MFYLFPTICGAFRHFVSVYTFAHFALLVNVISVLPDISSKIHLVQGDKLLLHRLHSQSKAFLKGERLIYKTFPLLLVYPFCLRRDPFTCDKQRLIGFTSPTRLRNLFPALWDWLVKIHHDIRATAFYGDVDILMSC